MILGVTFALHLSFGKDDKLKLKIIKTKVCFRFICAKNPNFVGETIPIVDRSSDSFIGTINEGDIFKLYLELQGQTIDLEKQ